MVGSPVGPTSGLNEQTAARLSQLFAKHEIQKTYIVFIRHKTEEKAGSISGDMVKARRDTWKLLPNRENPAVTQFHFVSLIPNLRLFVLQPKTGRTHQLCVAIKSLGSAVLGDELYGGKAKNNEKIDRTYLHAYRLQFDYLNEKIDIKALPETRRLFIEPEIRRKISDFLQEK